MKIKVFTVFHRTIDERLVFDLFQPPEIDEHFILYGVNPAHQKLVIKRDGRSYVDGDGVSNLLLEHRLAWHDGSIQSRGFVETSCYVHLLKNELHLPLDYIGVSQYDMRWPQPAAELLRRLARMPAGNNNTVYGFVCGNLMTADGKFHPLAFAHPRNWGFLLQSYNRFFKTNWDLRVLINKPFTLFQTYLLPREEFADLAAWLSVLCDEVYPWAC